MGLLLDKQMMIFEIGLQFYGSRSEIVHLCSARVILGSLMGLVLKTGSVIFLILLVIMPIDNI